MKRFSILILTILLSIAMTGCISGLNTMQQREYSAMESEGFLVEEKDPVLAAWLGILPGGGSFYARSPGLGICNLLFWPLSILWDPISGYDGAKAINYDLSKYYVKKKQQEEESKLDDKLATGEIDSTQYVIEKRKIEQKYDFQ